MAEKHFVIAAVDDDGRHLSGHAAIGRDKAVLGTVPPRHTLFALLEQDLHRFADH